VLKEVLDVLLAAIAPILPHMAEDAWQNLPYKVGTTSVFQAGWPKSEPHPPHKSAAWDFVRSVRADVNACMEKARVDKIVGANLDAEVFIHAPDAEKKALLASLLHDGSMLVEPRPAGFNGVDDLRFLFLVSGVTLVDSAEEVVAVLFVCVCERERERVRRERLRSSARERVLVCFIFSYAHRSCGRVSARAS
jgi:isoleucyl-tRNA synthetase